MLYLPPSQEDASQARKQLPYKEEKPENYLTPSVLKNSYALRTKKRNKSSKKSREGFNPRSKPQQFFPNTALPFGLIHALPSAQFGSSEQKFHFSLRSLDLVQLAQQLSSLFGENNQNQRLPSPGNNSRTEIKLSCTLPTTAKKMGLNRHAGAMGASLQPPQVGQSAGRRSDGCSFKPPPPTEFVCQNHSSDTGMNRDSAWKAFTKAEKLFLQAENLQKLETNISGAPAAAELGVHQAQDKASHTACSTECF